MPVSLAIDACCLNRPFDDQAQDRIRLEAEAVLAVLTRVASGEWEWVGSEVLGLEIDQTPDRERMLGMRLFTDLVGRTIAVGDPEQARAVELEGLGFHAFDALHLACAEAGGVDVLLTTDDRFLRLARRVSVNLRVRVENPLSWLQEVTGP
jgi:hypothetical protein